MPAPDWLELGLVRSLALPVDRAPWYPLLSAAKLGPTGEAGRPGATPPGPPREAVENDSQS